MAAQAGELLTNFKLTSASCSEISCSNNLTRRSDISVHLPVYTLVPTSGLDITVLIADRKGSLAKLRQISFLHWASTLSSDV